MEAHNYITDIEILGLWGRLDLKWRLRPDVNILSGLNGSGKSTIIRSLVQLFRSSRLGEDTRGLFGNGVITFWDGTRLESGEVDRFSGHRIDVVSTFDNRLKEYEAVQRLSDGAVRTELDWEIYRLQKRYMSYQLAQGREAIRLLTRHAPPEELEALTRQKILFFDLLDDLFRETGKTVDRNCDELNFDSDRGVITPYMLSSGEKQMLLILATVLTQNGAPAILLMDEPEISLHFDWQSSLIENIRRLNPQVQLVMSTHSPAVVMNGWTGHVTEISDLVVERR